MPIHALFRASSPTEDDLTAIADDELDKSQGGAPAVPGKAPGPAKGPSIQLPNGQSMPLNIPPGRKAGPCRRPRAPAKK